VLDFPTFRDRFDAIVVELSPSWKAVGFLAPDDKLYPLGTDSKVLSTIFEAMSAPIIQQIADEFRYTVEGAPQTIYPDFTLTPAYGAAQRIAIDIKTTYRSYSKNGRLQPFRYTLGSYTSFLRSPTATKNIKYPYADYAEHWVVGFLYTRAKGVPAKVYHRSEAAKALCPYQDVEYFVQEKHKIAGLAPGSGNTANIGSFPTNDIRDLREGRGPFAQYGKEICNEYWRNYGRTASEREYNSIEEFLNWKKKQG